MRLNKGFRRLQAGKDAGEDDIIAVTVRTEHLHQGFVHDPKKCIGFMTRYSRHGNCQMLETKVWTGNRSRAALQGPQVDRESALRTALRSSLSAPGCSPGPPRGRKSALTSLLQRQIEPMCQVSPCAFPQVTQLTAEFVVTFLRFLLQFQCIRGLLLYLLTSFFIF